MHEISTSTLTSACTQTLSTWISGSTGKNRKENWGRIKNEYKCLEKLKWSHSQTHHFSKATCATLAPFFFQKTYMYRLALSQLSRKFIIFGHDVFFSSYTANTLVVGNYSHILFLIYKNSFNTNPTMYVHCRLHNGSWYLAIQTQ